MTRKNQRKRKKATIGKYILYNKQNVLLSENKIHSQYQENKPNDMIHTESFMAENDNSKESKYNQCNGFLYYFKLPEIEGASVYI